MTIRLYGDPRRHRLARMETTRLAWTLCGIRFAWGDVAPLPGWAARCEVCK